MIITVTLNPAIDKTLFTDKIILHSTHKLLPAITQAGGKGINVSMVLKSLGIKNSELLTTGFVAGNNGDYIKRSLELSDLPASFVEIDGETRTNLKLIEADGALTEFNEIGPTPSTSDLDILFDKLKSYANEDTIFIFSGSLPGTLQPDFLESWFGELKNTGATIFFDASGNALVKGCFSSTSSRPDFIKPNVTELINALKLYKPNLYSDAEWNKLSDMGDNLSIDMVKELITFIPVKEILVSRGAQGALLAIKDSETPADKVQYYFCDSHKNLSIQSTVGAGDSMVAAYALAKQKKLPYDEALRFCVAVSAATVETKGTTPPDMEAIIKYYPGATEF